MAWLAEHFDTEYWTDWHSDLEAERRLRDEAHTTQALYGDRTRSGNVIPLGSVRRPHHPVDLDAELARRFCPGCGAPMVPRHGLWGDWCLPCVNAHDLGLPTLLSINNTTTPGADSPEAA